MSKKGPDGPAGKPPSPVLIPKNAQADLYADSVVTIDPKAAARLRQAAPEVSQGAFRERAFVPRDVMAPNKVVTGLRQALEDAATAPGELDRVRAFLKASWLPLVRQAVEQAGGDGLDGHLWQLLGRPKRVAKEPFLADLVAAYAKLNQAPTMEAMRVEGEKVIARVEQALSAAAPPAISLKALEEELEGRLNVDEVLSLLMSSDDELGSRLASVRMSLETIRNELKAGGTGGQPTSLLWNFTRIKAERIILEAERRRRGLA